MKNLKYIALALSLFLLTSCAKKENSKDNNTKENNTKVEENNTNNIETTEDEGLIPEDTKDSSKTLESKNISFETFDLDGNKVNSKELFNKNTNVLYFWTTTSDIATKMLTELNSLKDNDINVIGIVLDVDENNSMNIEDAKNILSENKIEFINLQTNPLIKEFSKDVNSVPASLIVDKDGNIISELFIGQRDASFFMEQSKK